ncbi:hypothetical protein KHA80_17565 [Anaerobacillus sp. HL2]|nr:hypothetical protein KHA80_17565 [Anaerobacillus sp. HL2]
MFSKYYRWINSYSDVDGTGISNQLEFLTFVEMALDLAINLLMSIEEQIDASVKDVEEPIMKIKASLDDTYEESSLLAEFLSGERKNDKIQSKKYL